MTPSLFNEYITNSFKYKTKFLFKSENKLSNNNQTKQNQYLRDLEIWHKT